MSDATVWPSSVACLHQSGMNQPRPQSQATEQGESHNLGDNDLYSEYQMDSFDGPERPANPRPRKRMRQISVDGFIEKGSDRRYLPVDTPEYIHNQRYSHFHQLPADLMPQIIDEISRHADTIFALRLVCRDFHAIFQPPFIIGPEERECFKAGLRRDDATWYPKYERLKSLDNISRVLCSACHARHPKSQFSDEELKKDPARRFCVGAQMATGVAADRDITFNGVRDLGLDQTRAGFQKVFLSKRKPNLPGAKTTRPVLEAVIAHTFNVRELQTLRQFRLLSLPASSSIPLDDLMWSLDNIEVMLCRGFHSISVCLEGNAVRLCSADDNIPPRSLETLVGLYEPFGKNWALCNCYDNQRHDDFHFYSLWRRPSGTQSELDDIILSFPKTYRPAIHDVDPAWSANVVRRLVQEQITLDEEVGARQELLVYQAEGRGEWESNAADVWVQRPTKKTLAWDQDDKRSLRERMAEVKRKRKQRSVDS